ncbi:unnamed protein product, partial [Porites lobata]
LKNDPSYDLSECVKVKISDGAKMSRSNNFIILFFNPSPNRRKGNKIIAAFLLMARELSGATSTYACLWCLSHKLDRWNTGKAIEHYLSNEMKSMTF